MMRRMTPLVLSLAIVLVLPDRAFAGSTDLALFQASARTAPPNIMILLDTSGSMKAEPGGWVSTCAERFPICELSPQVDRAQ